MPKLPVISGIEAIKALERLGFSVVRQRGSHIVLRKGSSGCVVPNHHELKVGTLNGFLSEQEWRLMNSLKRCKPDFPYRYFLILPTHKKRYYG
ncbi:MAG: type II toxin-antitoxin system HicA family toxin [Nitrosomonas sp.]|uniref:type II toxin-antitoxin system HicA family toxin n=1 Tax=Nitrosomonas sp. TaxID=42353 RepID=UPI0027335691|nr:type II toxin-antitoxin system HicA family toxin [Nitrosomonas sp.]MDP3281917.1 type II toxin-antitoxin system HicA family toxin [Nitrosomonas sp.]MDP3663368.1 type II toxin-antitoxin system HicA family toxin [Nitrosomonas sp.]MDZ4107938.1 type II toxin-antitoxin system HicA family toxin [Nitrosomonas sp.]